MRRGLAARHMLLALVSAVAVAGCNDQGKNEAPKDEAAAAGKQAAELPPGQLQLKPEAQKMLQIATLGGEGSTQTASVPARVAFQEDKVAAATLPVEARVVSVQAHVGDIVKAGDELATLVSPEALRMRYEVDAARTAKELAAIEAQRQRVMMDKGVGVEIELRAAQSKLRETSQELARAQGTAALLGSGSGDKIVLRATRAGVVAERNAVPGASADAGSALFLIGDPRAMGVVAEVFEGDLGQVRPGTAVKVEVPQLSATLAGKVRYVGAALDKESRRAPVYVELNEQRPELRTGMQARVELPVGEQAAQAPLLVPISAIIIKDGNRSVVFVQVADDRFEARDVRLGRPLHGMVPVLDGLKGGDKIVVRGGLLLDGAASQLL
ncbi:efflux RND transporter periplasmic adaptor subunit [Comamonas humi]